ncbi:ionotropic receptor 75a-like [Tribolium madens]|uniref:ionotropic receptor 75a-like n=1 Tax=Tribolium madens TaxID=41895 RepID=UPI001CF74DC9|nr:ionotropic receptor 75a-like [Tribolium madens]
MKPIFIGITLFFSLVQGDAETTFLLIINHLNRNNIKTSYFFSCWDKNETMRLMQMLNNRNIKFDFVEKKENAIIQALNEKSMTRYGYILDIRCKTFKNFLSEKISTINMRLSHPWLIISSELKAFVLKNVNLRMDSNVKFAIPEGEFSFNIFDVYNPGHQLGESPVVTKFGVWNGSHLNIQQTRTFYLQRRHMSYIKLRSGSVVLIGSHSGTFEEYMFDSRFKQLDTMSKFHYPMFLLLEDVHNFTHTLKIEDKWFGNYQNGTDSGVGKLLYENEIDITCTGASQRPPRVDVYDYLMPSYHFRPCYIFRNPGTYNPLENQFLKPFTDTVWYVTVVTTVLVCLFMKIFHRLENKFVGIKADYSWATAMLITYSIIVQQDSYLFPTGLAGRISFFVLQVLSILLYNYYTSSIISSLLSKPPEAFHTLDELGHSKLEIGIENLPYTITWFEIMNDSDVQYIYKNKVFPPNAKKMNIYEPEEGIAKVKQGGFAYHTQLDTGYPIIARTFNQEQICDITEIPMIPQVGAGIMLQKISQYKEVFHITLRKAKEVGLVHRISQIWESKKPECLSSIRVVAVGSDQTFIAFLMLFIGMALSLVFLVIEIAWSRFNLDAKITKNKKFKC